MTKDERIEKQQARLKKYINEKKKIKARYEVNKKEVDRLKDLVKSLQATITLKDSLLEKSKKLACNNAGCKVRHMFK